MPDVLASTEVETHADLTDPLVVALAWALTRLAAEGVRRFIPPWVVEMLPPLGRRLVAWLGARLAGLDGPWLDAKLPPTVRPYVPIFAMGLAGIIRAVWDLAQAGELGPSTVARAIASGWGALATQVVGRIPAKAAEAVAVSREGTALPAPARVSWPPRPPEPSEGPVSELEALEAEAATEDREGPVPVPLRRHDP